MTITDHPHPEAGAPALPDSALAQYDLTILYGSQTGNAEYLAHQILEKAQAAGISCEIFTMNEALSDNKLVWKRLLIVTSTHDNGHMPDNSNAFWQWLQQCPDRQYEGLPYAVLTIGDSMYDDYCKAGQDLDRRFSELGASPIAKMKECDVDFDMTSTRWIKQFLAAVPDVPSWEPTGTLNVASAESQSFFSAPSPVRTARVVASRRLSGSGSAKRVFDHELEFDATFEYECGDSIDVFAPNSEALVAEWLEVFTDVDEVLWETRLINFTDLLRNHVELRLPHVGLINSLLSTCPPSETAESTKRLVESGNRQVIDTWLWGKDVLEIVLQLGAHRTGAQSVVDALRPLQPRSYSIASSPRGATDRLHLTVSSIDYEANRRRHSGTGSGFLERASASGEEFKVQRIASHDFHLPATDAPIIMIGPGVGIAPFIGFLHDLQARQATNPTWLFFGNQHRKDDWLYETEIRRWQDDGTLSKLSLAFSRDQESKHYVQDELRINSEELLGWIVNGAYIYICGDKDHMAHDVETMLIAILSAQEERTVGEARLAELRDQGRYLKDVY